MEESLTSDVIEGECGVDVVDVVQKVEEIQVVFLRYPFAMVSETKRKTWKQSTGKSHSTIDNLPFLHALDLLDFLLLRVSRVSQKQFSKVSLGNVTFLVGILSLKLQSQDFALQLVLEVQKLFYFQFLVELDPEKVAGECGVDALKVCTKKSFRKMC